MMDFIDLGMRKIAYNNAVYCAEKVGYFNNNNLKSANNLDADFEKCLGKFSDSYECGLDVMTQHLTVMN